MRLAAAEHREMQDFSRPSFGVHDAVLSRAWEMMDVAEFALSSMEQQNMSWCWCKYFIGKLCQVEGASHLQSEARWEMEHPSFTSS